MTSELRPALAVWQEAYGVWGDPSLPDTSEADHAAAAVIEADRAEVVGEIVAWLRTKDNYDFDDLAIDIEAKFGKG